MPLSDKNTVLRPVGRGGVQGGACAPPFEINDIHKPQYPSHEACAEVLNCSQLSSTQMIFLTLVFWMKSYLAGSVNGYPFDRKIVQIQYPSL